MFVDRAEPVVYEWNTECEGYLADFPSRICCKPGSKEMS